MGKTTVADQAVPGSEPVPIDLKDPGMAALLAWLVPGLGHIYQGRTAKGLLFMICILGTFFYGLVLGQGKVVYASWRPHDRRLSYVGQVGVGLPALPALIQARRVGQKKEPLFGGWMAPPVERNGRFELDVWHRELNRYFELGTLYTVIAGLLNVLAIYDAWGGPAIERRDEEEPDEGSG